MKAGRRRHFVTLEDRPDGRAPVAMSPASLYVEIAPESPGIEDEAGVTHTIRGPWHDQVTTDTVIHYGSREFHVMGRSDDDERGRDMTLYCQEVRTPGDEAED